MKISRSAADIIHHLPFNFTAPEQKIALDELHKRKIDLAESRADSV